MNYLAHIYLSGTDPQHQLGGLLGDFVKGPLRAEYPDKIEQGIRLHRRIDSVTDSDSGFRQRLVAIPKPWRRFGGIILDVYFDHLLASQWQNFHDEQLDDYCQRFYSVLHQHHGILPERARHFAKRAPEINWLENYANRDMIPLMLNNLGKRLRHPVRLGDALPELYPQIPMIEQTFTSLMRSHKALATQFLKEHP